MGTSTWKRNTEVKPGDLLCMTKRVAWRVIAVRPYEGPLAELADAVSVETDKGPVALEAHVLHEVIS